MCPSILTKFLRYFFGLFLIVLNTQSIAATFKGSHETITLKSTVPDLAPSSEFWLIMDWALDDPWHIYSQKPGDIGTPPSITFDLPDGITVQETVWSEPQDLSADGMQISGYKKSAQMKIRLKTGEHIRPNAHHSIRAHLQFSICHDVCIREKATLQLDFPTTHIAEMPISNGLLPVAILLLMAFIGGAILNLMPCVLPVLALKLLDLTKLGHDSNTSKKAHILSYTAGILITFQILAGMLITLRLAGHHVGWGFQLQSPLFIGFLACLFLVMALNLFGVFDMGILVQHMGMRITPTKKTSGTFGSFFNGILACLVATPCSAPFMGTAIAAALVQPIWVIVLIFLALGLGLALPFLALLFCPSIINHIPKPGIWMNTLRQFMGFLMMATTLWLVWILSGQTDDALLPIFTALFSLSLGLWSYGILGAPHKSTIVRTCGHFILIFGLCSAATGIWVLNQNQKIEQPDQKSLFIPYTESAIQNALAQGKGVLINFTARWCLTCQVNKKMALDTEAVGAHIQRNNIIAFEADWTHYHDDITLKLESFGQNSIPFLVYYPPRKAGVSESKPVFLSALYTENDVLNLMKQ